MSVMEIDGRNRRIAKNTLILYVRMVFLMLVNIYTSRVVLAALGVQDYGIYNVVGGVVSMFTILSGSMSSAISRFITFELGRESAVQRLREVFGTSVTVQIAIGLIILLIGESVGPWFINEKMNIAADRLHAANWVFQLSLLAFIVNLLSIPYNATIIAYEKMSAFAYISILEALLKLGIAFLIISAPFDSLIYYSVLTCVVAVLVRVAYSVYCRMHFDEVRFRPAFDKGLFREMFAFAGWNFIGNGVYMMNTQGINVLSNIFFGVTVNAARGVVAQVESAITQFVNNFTTAINPQITKSYAAGDRSYMFGLVCKGAKYSYLMMLLFSVTVILESDTILEIWLKTVPEHASVFLKSATVCSLITVLSNTLVTAMFATGDIKKYQIIVGSVGLAVFPACWFLFKIGCPPVVAYVVYGTVYAILLFVRLYLMRGMIGMPVGMYVRDVLLRIIPITMFSFMIPYVLVIFMEPSLLRLLLTLISSIIVECVAVWFIGLDKDEKIFVRNKSITIINKFKCR